MRIRVKLYGTLRGGRSADGLSEGTEVEIPSGATARELLRRLGIAESRTPTVVMDGRIVALDDPVEAGASVSVFEAIGGG